MKFPWSRQRTPIFEPKLIRRYNTAGPRYTSYPSVHQFQQRFGETEYRAATETSNKDATPRPLSLDFHIPFCETTRLYCSCKKIVTANHVHVGPYVEHLCREVAVQGALIDHERRVDQLHWGGGTLTFLNHAQMQRLMQCTREHFNLRNDDGGDYSVEIDPCRADAQIVTTLRRMGFNRMSMGVQDFDPLVQRAINRVQTESKTRSIVEAARSEGFRSICVDLIYGLPLQSVQSFGQTLDKVVALDPDRLSVFSYAHLPHLFETQRQIDDRKLPSPDEKLNIMSMTVERLIDSGYIHIGMDHFAKPEDELAIAQKNGSLHCNFQGYTTHSDCDLVGIGVAGISAVGNTYSQNVRHLDEYYPRVDAGRLAVYRGIQLTPDDLLRRQIIVSLLCQGTLLIQPLEEAYRIHFQWYFQRELDTLERMERDGLIRSNIDAIEVSPRGRFLIRSICMAFDRYLHKENVEPRYSRLIQRECLGGGRGDFTSVRPSAAAPSNTRYELTRTSSDF